MPWWLPSRSAISPEGIDVDTRSGTFFIGGGFTQRAVFEVAGIITAGPGVATVYGTGCPDSGNTVPVLNAWQAPHAGTSVAIAFQGSASVQSLGWFVVGISRVTIPLAQSGAGTCVLNNDPLVVLPPFVTSIGRAGFVLAYPASLGPSTFMFTGVFLPDGTANGIGLSGSNGLELAFQ